MMRKMLGTMIVLFVGIAMISCASSPPSAKGPLGEGYFEGSGAGRALVVFIRPRNFSGSANRYKIMYNGARILDLANGCSFEYMAPAGQAEFTGAVVRTYLNTGILALAQKKAAITVSPQAGARVYIAVTVGSLGDPVFTEIDSAKASELGKGTKELGLFE